MRLNFVPTSTVTASRVIGLLLEAPALPRWQFDYTGRKAYDPKPDILVLGAFKHPNTGNRLVGGINLNYLTSAENERLEKILPEIMRGRNLYERYNIGRLHDPLIFDTYYRTYNNDFISMIGKSKIYPRYGTFVRTQDDTKEFKPAPARKAQEPADISRIDGEVQAGKLQDIAIPTGPGKEPPRPPEPPVQDIELQRHATQVQDEIEQGEEVPPPAEYEAPVERPEAPEEMPDYDVLPAEPEVEREPIQRQLDAAVEPQQPERRPQSPAEPAQQRPVPTLGRPKDERPAARPEIQAPEITPEETPDDNEDDLDSYDDTDAEELQEHTIRYYSPKHKRFIVEQWTRSR
jgi:hypothetical protein